jgi:protein-disulfide isomerase
MLENLVTAVTLLCAVGMTYLAVSSQQNRGTRGAAVAQRALSSDQWSKLTNGNPDVNVVMFSDVQCRGCRSLSPHISRARIAYAGRVRFQLRSFPMPYHRLAFPAAAAIACASGEFERWDLHDQLLLGQDSLEKTDLVRAASYAGLKDTTGLRECIEGEDGRRRVQSDLRVADELGLLGTPTVIIDGSYVENPDSLELMRRIEAAIKRRK